MFLAQDYPLMARNAELVAEGYAKHASEADETANSLALDGLVGAALHWREKAAQYRADEADQRAAAQQWRDLTT